MKKNYIKMNDGNYLSLGNIINVIKNVSNNKNAMQMEIFCSIFGINNVNITTINNYCIGIRAIGLEYKKIFQNKYENDDLIDNITAIISILDDKIYQSDIITINDNIKLKTVINELIEIANNDEHIDDSNIFIKENSYETIKELLYYAILVNKQPIYTQDINIKINKKELDEYMKTKLYWGQSHIGSLIELASKNNMFACAELGSLEFDGYISGKQDFEKSYYYYLKAAKKNHPRGCWMVANLMITNRVKFDFDTMWKYLNKSVELGSAAGYNTLGLCYLRGITKDKKVNKEKAEYYFRLSSDLGYPFAFNNLGKLYEETDMEEAIKYYKESADLNNSWALNKVGEYYRNQGKIKEAFMYYNEAIKCPIKERCKYAYYNLSEYYYRHGNDKLGIKKDIKLSDEYMSIFNNMP